MPKKSLFSRAFLVMLRLSSRSCQWVPDTYLLRCRRICFRHPLTESTSMGEWRVLQSRPYGTQTTRWREWAVSMGNPCLPKARRKAAAPHQTGERRSLRSPAREWEAWWRGRSCRTGFAVAQPSDPRTVRSRRMYSLVAGGSRQAGRGSQGGTLAGQATGHDATGEGPPTSRSTFRHLGNLGEGRALRAPREAALRPAVGAPAPPLEVLPSHCWSHTAGRVGGGNRVVPRRRGCRHHLPHPFPSLRIHLPLIRVEGHASRGPARLALIPIPRGRGGICPSQETHGCLYCCPHRQTSPPVASARALPSAPPAGGGRRASAGTKGSLSRASSQRTRVTRYPPRPQEPSCQAYG